jgi:hypothetical protein
VPTPGMKVVVDTMGNKMVIPKVEPMKLEDVIKLNLYKEPHLIECCIGKLKHSSDECFHALTNWQETI